LRDDDGKKQWTINTPARPFFGLHKKDIQTLGNAIVDDIKYDVKRRK
jgi:phage gpG-like protein